MSLECGRYEFSEGSSNKFWQILPRSDGRYEAVWGRIGTAGQGPKIYDEAEAYQKINEKISKGYRLVERAEKTKARATLSKNDPSWEARQKRRAKEIADAENFLSELKKV
jgi:predicted DNA-binding WGR domain protein